MDNETSEFYEILKLQQEIVSLRVFGPKLYEDYLKKELKLIRKRLESTIPFNDPEFVLKKNSIKFDEYKIIPDANKVKEIELKVATLEKCRLFSQYRDE